MGKIEVVNPQFCSSRVASRGILLAESQSDEFNQSNAPDSSQAQSLEMVEFQSPSTSGMPASSVSRFKEKFKRLWLSAVQRWPTVYFLF